MPHGVWITGNPGVESQLAIPGQRAHRTAPCLTGKQLQTLEGLVFAARVRSLTFGVVSLGSFSSFWLMPEPLCDPDCEFDLRTRMWSQRDPRHCAGILL